MPPNKNKANRPSRSSRPRPNNERNSRRCSAICSKLNPVTPQLSIYRAKFRYNLLRIQFLLKR